MENIVEKLYSELHIDINLVSKKGFPYIGKRQDNKSDGRSFHRKSLSGARI